MSVRRFITYAAIGAVGTAVHYAVLLAGVAYARLDAVTASSLGAVAGAVVNYLANYTFNFNASRGHAYAAPRFFLVAAAGVLVNGACMLVLAHMLQLHFVLAQLLSTAVVLVLTYGANSVWSFRSR